MTTQTFSHPTEYPHDLDHYQIMRRGRDGLYDPVLVTLPHYPFDMWKADDVREYEGVGHATDLTTLHLARWVLGVLHQRDGRRRYRLMHHCEVDGVVEVPDA